MKNYYCRFIDDEEVEPSIEAILQAESIPELAKKFVDYIEENIGVGNLWHNPTVEEFLEYSSWYEETDRTEL